MIKAINHPSSLPPLINSFESKKVSYEKSLSQAPDKKNLLYKVWKSRTYTELHKVIQSYTELHRVSDINPFPLEGQNSSQKQDYQNPISFIVAILATVSIAIAAKAAP